MVIDHGTKGCTNLHHNVCISQVVLSLGFIWGDLFFHSKPNERMQCPSLLIRYPLGMFSCYGFVFWVNLDLCPTFRCSGCF